MSVSHTQDLSCVDSNSNVRKFTSVSGMHFNDTSTSSNNHSQPAALHKQCYEHDVENKGIQILVTSPPSPLSSSSESEMFPSLREYQCGHYERNGTIHPHIGILEVNKNAEFAPIRYGSAGDSNNDSGDSEVEESSDDNYQPLLMDHFSPASSSSHLSHPFSSVCKRNIPQFRRHSWICFDVENGLGSGRHGIDTQRSPSMILQSSGMPHSQRRESFLYRSDHDIDEGSPNNLTRNSALLNEQHGIEDLIVTPFAQVLASLRRVRNEFLVLTNTQPPNNRRSPITLAKPPGSPTINSNPTPGSEEFVLRASNALDELDWCLDQLDKVQTHRSVSEMASNKFRKMLNKELNQLSGMSKSGNQVSEYISSTFLDHQNDVISPSDDNEKRPPSPNIAALNKVGKNKKLTREFRPISEITGTRTCPNKDIVKRWTKIPPYGVPINNDEALAQELETIDQWGGLDVFKLARLSNNRPLTCVMYTICKKRDMFKKFKLEPDKFLTYIMTLEDHYRDVSYHNRIHAADVVQSVHSLLSIPSLKDLFSDLEVLSALIASAIHDVDHPGVSNQYHCANYTELALLYNDTSVLEMHHLAVGFKLMMQEHCNLFEHFSRKQWQLFRKMVIDMVLATDMSKHMQLVANLKTMVETKKVASSGVLELDQYTDRIEVLKNLVHCADLSNPIKPLDMYKQWTNRIMEEYWVQGDIERDLGAEISPMCDRYNANVEKSQVMFIDFVVYPLVEIWAELVSPHAQSMLIALTNNREYYASLMPGSPSPVSEKKENWEKEEKVIEEDLIAEVVLEETVNITTEQDSPSSSSSPKERSSLSKWLFSDKTRAGKS